MKKRTKSNLGLFVAFTVAAVGATFAAFTYEEAAAYEQAAKEPPPAWRQYPNTPLLSDSSDSPGIKPLSSIAAWISSRQSSAAAIRAGEDSETSLGAMVSFVGSMEATACDAADGVGITFTANDFLADPNYKFVGVRAECDAALAAKYLAAKSATEAALSSQPAEGESFSVGLIEGTGGQYLNEKIYSGPFVGFAKGIAAKSGRPARANPFALNLTSSYNYDMSGVLSGLGDDVVLVKPGNMSAALVNMGWRPIAQATNGQAVVLVGDESSEEAIAEGNFSVAMTSYQALLGRGAWALMREMIREDLMPNSNGGRSDFTFHATQEGILKAAGGKTIGAVSPGVLEKFLEKNPERKFKILGKSKELAHWMVLANPDSSRVSDAQIAAIRAHLIGLGKDEKTQEMLKKLNIKGFEAPNLDLVSSTGKMIEERESIMDPEFEASLKEARRKKYVASIPVPESARLWGMAR